MPNKPLMRQANNKTVTKGYFGLVYLLIVVLSANQFLNLGAWVHMAGVFNVRDVGNFMIILGIGFLLLNRGLDPALQNRMSILILLYLFMVAIHVALATLYYGQPLRQGILGARHHFFYLSFFLFLIVLDSPAKIRRFLNMLTGLALVTFALAIINYLGPTIFVHQWAEGHGVRSGIERGFIPGMSIISVAAIWEFSKITERGRMGVEVLSAFILFAAHVFRQTRMRTMGLILVIIWMLVTRKRFGALIAVLFIGFTGAAALQMATGNDILGSQIFTAVQDFTKGEGTWRGRKEQLETAVDAFVEHPVLGSGSLVLRADEAGSPGSYRELYALQYKADLGYASWIKSFGIVGALWLFLFMYFWWMDANKTQRITDSGLSVEICFVKGLLIYFAGTFVTLNHFMYPGAIVLVCMGAAMVVRLKSAAASGCERI